VFSLTTRLTCEKPFLTVFIILVSAARIIHKEEFFPLRIGLLCLSLSFPRHAWYDIYFFSIFYLLHFLFGRCVARYSTKLELAWQLTKTLDSFCPYIYIYLLLFLFIPTYHLAPSFRLYITNYLSCCVWNVGLFSSLRPFTSTQTESVGLPVVCKSPFI
jgi:hypothetical protein